MLAYDKLYINGKWVEGSSDKVMEDRCPMDGSLLYTYKAASKDDVDKAYAAARAAFPGWAKTTPGEKAAMLEKLANAIEEMADEVAEVLIMEGGSTAPKVGFEISTCINICKQAMAFPYMLRGETVASDIPGKDNFVYKAPKGVIGVIAPWNVPLVLAMRSVVPAVATGNTVVLKPASDTPATAFLVAKFFEKAGFPAGVFNAVVGKGSEIGDYFVEHETPELISFTGSTEVGKQIGRTAGGQIKDVSLELGGNNVMLVLKDADLSKVIGAAIFGAFFNVGQVCMALNRIIVEEPLYDAFVEAFVGAVKTVKVGDPHDPEVFIGPIISETQVKSVEGFIKANIEAGATVALEGHTEGNYIYPWVFTDCTNDMPACCNEVFGPVVCIIKCKDEEEGIAIANDTEYGLSGCVFTEDLYHGIQVAQRIESGMTHVNDQSINDEPHVMFGGAKHSGVGRFNYTWVVDKFTTTKWISVQTNNRFG
ncbi:MAG: aldehyde dehydrogenase family protein [Lachnospiraceae bacterium]|nr:aldehyde dehydrogenase family protein [Lachnospiraceae bacterium]